MKKFLCLFLSLISFSVFSQQNFNKLNVKDLTNTNTATFNTSYTGVAKLSSGILSASPLSNADISNSAAIAYSKFASLLTGQVLLGNAGVPTATTLSGGATVGATGVVTLGNAAVITQLLTGYISSAGVVTGSDSILSAIQKVDGNVQSLTASATTAINGKQSLSTLSAKGDIYIATASSTSTKLGVGENGSVLSVDTGAANLLGYRNIKEDESVSLNFPGWTDVTSWTKGRNATLMGGGSFVGGLVRDTTTQIAPSGSYKYTQSAGSQNEYFCTTPVTLYKGDKGENFFTAKYTYDGQSGDIQTYLWDATNSVPLNIIANKAIGATNSALSYVYAVNIPDSTNSVQACYQVKTLNSGKILNLAKIQLTKSLSSLGVVNNTNMSKAQNAGPIVLSATTTAPTKGTTTLDRVMYSQIGSKLFAEYQYYQTAGGSAGSGDHLFSLPVVNGRQLTFSSNIVPYTGDVGSSNGISSAGGQAAYIGTGHIGISGTNRGPCFLFAYNSTQFRAICQLTYSAYKAHSNGFFAITGAVAFTYRVETDVNEFDAGNAQVASSNQITSSDSIPFVFKSTAIVDADPIGTYNVYAYPSGSNAPAISASAPTQTASSMNTDGVRVFSRAYNAASVAGSPTRVDIKVGSNFRGADFFGYGATGKTLPVRLDKLQPSTIENQGMDVTYDEKRGILSLDAGFTGGGVTSSFFKGAQNTSDTNYASAYISFNTGASPSISVIPNASLCNNSECIDQLSGNVTSANVITNDDPRAIWISTASWASGVLTVNFPTSFFTSIPRCWAIPVGAIQGQRMTIDSVATTGVIFRNRANDGTGDATPPSANIFCKKTGKDAYPAQYKVTGLNDISVSYWVSANFTANASTPINFDSKEWDNCTPSCVTVSPTAWRFTAPKSGVYTITGFSPTSTVNAYVNMYKNSSNYKNVNFGTVSGGVWSQMSTAVKLLQGEYIDFRPNVPAGFYGGGLTGNPVTNIAIQRTGEY